MRILFVQAYYPPFSVGGAEESTFELAQALRELGHSVTVLAPLLGDADTNGPTGLVTVDLGVRSVEPGKPLPPRVFDNPLRQLRFAQAVRDAAANFDVVHCQALHVLPGAYLGARRAGLPIIATIRDLGGVCPVAVCLLDAPRVPADCGLLKLERVCVPQFADLYGPSPRLRLSAAALLRFGTARLRSAILRRCDAVTAVGSDLGPLYAEAGLLREPAHVLPNIVRPAMSQPSTYGGAYALYVGKVSHGKGIRYLLDAVERVLVDHPDFRLVVAGYADSRWGSQLKAARGVDYEGRVPRSRVATLYQGARMALVPSIWPEPLPRVALEAAAAGVPVVATRVGGIPDVVEHDRTGLLVPPRDSDALADAIATVWSDPMLARRLGDAARRDVTIRFSAGPVARRAEGLYSSVLGAAA